MEQNILPEATAPSPLILGVGMEKSFNYHFIIKRRSFWCYKNYLKLEINNDHYVINYKNGILEIPKEKPRDYIIDILKTIGISNKHIFKIYVMNGEILMSKKILYDLNSIINFVNKTEIIMADVKYN
tara:strand:- start:444 stop:824 length:381 start_codon:yes stop_codon:yes gene_type:complete